MKINRFCLLLLTFISIIFLSSCAKKNEYYIKRELYYSMSYRQILRYMQDIITEDVIMDKEGKKIPFKFLNSFYFTIPVQELCNENNWEFGSKCFFLKIEKDLTMTAFYILNNIKYTIKYSKQDYYKYKSIIEYYLNNEIDNEEIKKFCK
jgi:hypothetical protein